MDFSQYETSVAKYLVANNPEYEVRYNQRLPGARSRANRQVDVLLTRHDGEHRVVVECKYHDRKLDVGIVESFIGFLQDVGVSDGILITNRGVSRSAARRVSDASIRIRILTESDLELYRIRGLLPHEDGRMAIFSEPNGWVVSPIVYKIRACCVLLPIGFSYARGIDQGNYLYVNICSDPSLLDAIVNGEIADIDAHYEGKKTHLVRRDGRFLVRRSFLRKDNRCDLAIIAVLSNGLLLVHGVLKRQDVAWTVSSLKKALRDAWLLEVELESMTEEEIRIRIVSARREQSGK
jgi:hypothetical protein